MKEDKVREAIEKIDIASRTNNFHFVNEAKDLLKEAIATEPEIPECITQCRLKELLEYDAGSGLFTWKKDMAAHVHAGDIAGNMDGKGYWMVTVDGKGRLAHRLAWLYVYGEWPDGEIDHINHQITDNRIDNLRVVTRRGNMMNRAIGSNNTSGHMGVMWKTDKKRWKAYIHVNGKQKHLGYFKDIKDAIIARQAAIIEYGYHENHGSSDWVK